MAVTNFKMKRGLTEMMALAKSGQLGSETVNDTLYSADTAAKDAEKDRDKIVNDTKHRWYVTDNFNPYKLYWDWWIIFCAAYSGFSVPIEVAFVRINYIFDNYPATHMMDILVDFIFLIDIVVGFLTAYIDSRTGDKITNPKKIAKRYMYEGFMFDMISSIPFLLAPF